MVVAAAGVAGVAAAAVGRWRRWRRMSMGLICAVCLACACPARRLFASGAERCLTSLAHRNEPLLGAPAQIWHGWVVVVEELVVIRRVREVGLFGEQLFENRRERRGVSGRRWRRCDG